MVTISRDHVHDLDSPHGSLDRAGDDVNRVHTKVGWLAVWPARRVLVVCQRCKAF